MKILEAVKIPRTLAAATGAAVLTLGLMVSVVTALPATAAGQPVITGMTVTPQVVLYATVGSTATVTAEVAPSDPSDPTDSIASVVASFRVITPITSHVSTLTNVSLSTTDGEHWAGSVSVPRDAAPGHWDAFVTATDAAGTPETSFLDFSILDNTHVTLAATPSAVHALGDVTLSGTLRDMHPGSTADASGTYQPYPGKELVLLSPDAQAIPVKTNSKGQFSYSTQATTSGTWRLIFPGTSLHYGGTATAVVRMVHNSTRFSAFNVTPEPAYRHGYVHITGTLERNDPNSSRWLPYRNRTFTVYRGTPATYVVAAVTDTHGNFDFTLHGVDSTVTGTWHASFTGTPYNAPSLSVGDHVLTRTPPLEITKVSFNPPGPDDPVTNDKLNLEYATITNTGAHTANLVGWAIHDATGNTYLIGHDVYVTAGRHVNIHVGVGTDTATDLYWGQTGYIWDNGGDTATLVTDKGTDFDTCTWGSAGGTIATC